MLAPVDNVAFEGDLSVYGIFQRPVCPVAHLDRAGQVNGGGVGSQTVQFNGASLLVE